MVAKTPARARDPKAGHAFAEIKGQLRSYGIRLKKGLGQNLLVDQDILQTIVEAAELNDRDVVVEVGPGLGILTSELVKRAKKVIAVEFDPQLAAALKKRLGQGPNLTIINEDILHLQPEQLLERAGVAAGSLGRAGGPSYKVVANLPYYITSPTLRHFLEARTKPSLMVVMAQKEVAERIVADPGKMSLLSVSVQIYSSPKIIEYVSAQSFYPPPEVDSAILRLDVYPRPAVDIEDISGFFEVVGAGFVNPRKQLHNSLSRGLWLPPGGATDLLRRAGIDPMRRAQTLSLQEWADVCREFVKLRHEAKEGSH